MPKYVTFLWAKHEKCKLLMTSNLYTVLISKLLGLNLQFFVEKKPNAPGIKPLATMSVWDV